MLNFQNEKDQQGNYSTHQFNVNKLKTIETMEDTLAKRRIKLLGHIIRAQPMDPVRLSTLKMHTPDPVYINDRRVGGPRKHWTEETFELCWNKHCKKDNNNVLYNRTQQHRQIIETLAVNRNI